MLGVALAIFFHTIWGVGVGGSHSLTVMHSHHLLLFKDQSLMTSGEGAVVERVVSCFVIKFQVQLLVLSSIWFL